MSALGNHILVEFYGCTPEILNKVSLIEKSMVSAAQEAGATVINSTFHHFSPYGVSGVVVIQESHLAIHTWPEYGYAAVDLFTCGDEVDPWVSFDFLKKAFEAQNYSALDMKRGSLNLLQRKEFDLSSMREEANKHVNPDKFTRNVWFTDKDENQALSLRYTGEVFYDEKSEFQDVAIYESYAYGKMLTIDNMVMCTEKDEFHYHEMIVHPALQILKQAKNVLVIGGGDGGTIREIFKYPNIENVTMVEIDEKVIEASKKFLPTIACEFDNPKLDLKIDDGIRFVKESPAGVYDVVIVDGSDPVGPAQGLFSEEFYTNCQRVLKDTGILVAQGESPKFNSKVFVELNHCLKNIFGQGNVFCSLFFATTYPTGMWSIQYGIKGDANLINNFKEEETAEFCLKNNLKYYNESVHRASLALPTFVKNMLDGK
jgi:spermidine synthase